jgi:hypothetical protein
MTLLLQRTLLQMPLSLTHHKLWRMLLLHKPTHLKHL